MSDPVQRAFSLTAGLYDQDRSRLIPCFESFYHWAVELIPDSAGTILDLGAGTGLLSAFVRRRYPEAKLHLVDFSGAMLARAEVRFKGDRNVSFALANYCEGSLGESYDAVVSALSIHHLEDQAKQKLFVKILGLLRPGGVFVNAEQVLGPTPALEARYKHVWLEQVRALGATAEQIADSLLRQGEDRCTPVEDQLTWMREAGFREVDCWFKAGRFAVFAGVK